MKRYWLSIVLAIATLFVVGLYLQRVAFPQQQIPAGTQYRGQGGDFSFIYPDGWFVHEDEPLYALFAREKHVEGMPHDHLGANFSASVSQLADLKGAKTPEEWLSNMGVHQGNPLFVSREQVKRNGVAMTRVVFDTSGIGHQVLMYVHFTDDGRVLAMTHAPYNPASIETQSFEAIVKSFKAGAGVAVQQQFDHKAVYTTDMSQDKAKYEADCRDRGGKFSGCGSPCPADSAVCIQVCAYTCEW